MLAASGKKVILLSSVIQTGQFVLPAERRALFLSEPPSLRLWALQFQLSLQWFGDCAIHMGLSVTGALAGEVGPRICSCVEWLDVLIPSAAFTHAYQGHCPVHSSCLLCYSHGQWWREFPARLHSKALEENLSVGFPLHTPHSSAQTALFFLRPQCIQPWPHLHSCLVSLRIALPAPGSLWASLVLFSILSVMGIEPLFNLISFTPSHTEAASNSPSYLEVPGCYL